VARVLPGAEPLPAAGLPRHRAIVALDIERSTSRPDPVKAELRRQLYELFDTALLAAGIRRQYRDRFADRGDGILALIHPCATDMTASTREPSTPSSACASPATATPAVSTSPGNPPATR